MEDMRWRICDGGYSMEIFDGDIRWRYSMEDSRWRIVDGG
jgi:hypothetical protein